MATKAEILAILASDIDSATEVKFQAVGDIPAGSIVTISTTADLPKGEVSRSVASGGGDTVLSPPLVILQQG